MIPKISFIFCCKSDVLKIQTSWNNIDMICKGHLFQLLFQDNLCSWVFHRFFFRFSSTFRLFQVLWLVTQVMCFLCSTCATNGGLGWAFQIRAQSCVKMAKPKPVGETMMGHMGTLLTTQVVGFSVFYSQSGWMVQQKKLGRTLGGNGRVHLCFRGSKTKMNRSWSWKTIIQFKSQIFTKKKINTFVCPQKHPKLVGGFNPFEKY